MPSDKSNEKRKQAEAVYQAVSLGLVFPVAIGVGYFLGRWLDGVFGTKPWITIVFTGFGIAAAFVSLFRAGLASDADTSDTSNGPDGKQ